MANLRRVLLETAALTVAALVLLAPILVFAQGNPPPGPALAQNAAALIDNPLASFSNFFAAVRDGQYWIAGMFALFFLVGGVRTVGKKIHVLIPDDTKHPLLSPVEATLRFIFDTKIGGWLLNWTTSISGCLAAAYLAGAHVDGAAWKTAVLISTSATTLIELKDDVVEWWERRGKANPPAVIVPPPPPTAPGGGSP